MIRAALLCPALLLLAGCGAPPQGNVGFKPASDTIAISDAAGRAASEKATRAAANAQCAAMGRQAYYVESQANLSKSANEHLYLCW
jgi:hypothetical protein